MKIEYINFHKRFPNSTTVCDKWLNIKRYYGNQMIYIFIKHHLIKIDLRENKV